MKIQDTPLHDVIFFLAERMMRRARDITREVFAAHQFDVTVDQWVLLKQLYDKGKVSQAELAEATFRDPASVTRSMALLSRQGWITRNFRSGSRKEYEVDLSPEGEALVERMIPVVQDLRAQAMQGVSAKDAERSAEMLRRMYDNLGN